MINDSEEIKSLYYNNSYMANTIHMIDGNNKCILTFKHVEVQLAGRPTIASSKIIIIIVCAMCAKCVLHTTLLLFIRHTNVNAYESHIYWIQSDPVDEKTNSFDVANAGIREDWKQKENNEHFK